MRHDRSDGGVPAAAASTRVRSVARRVTWLSCALSCAALLWTASASAFVHRGHVFSSTFEGAGAEAFTNATGVAVSEATGEVYVVDPGHERVERFKQNGTGGYAFVSEFTVPGPAAIAIDNDAASPSYGDIYVSGVSKKGEQEVNYVYKFRLAGGTVEKIYKQHIFKAKEKVEGEAEEKETLEETVELEAINGLAVDASGKLWVDWGEAGEVAGFSNGVITKGVASDKNNRLIVSTIKEAKEGPNGENFTCRAVPGFAVAPNDEAFYVAHERESGAGECPEEATPPNQLANVLVAKINASDVGVASGVDNEDTTGVAVDRSNGDAYVDNATSVAAYTSAGSFIQRFGSGQLSGGGALATDATAQRVFVAEGSKVAVFVPEEPGAAPSVEGVQAQDLTPTSTRLTAEIDPHGSDTHYFFQYGTADCQATPASCADVPAAPGADIGSGFGDQPAEATLEGLRPDTVYHYRVIAQNEHGTSESAQATSTFFTTLPSSEGLLADNREWEMVSPSVKGGPLQPMSLEGASIQSSADGNAITYGAEGSGPVGEPQGNRSVAVTQFLSTRGSSEWSTQDIVTPHNKGEGLTPGFTEEYRVFSSDLSLGLVEPEGKKGEPLENPALAPPAQEEEKQEKTIYVRADPPVTPGAAEQAVYEEAAANSGYLAPGYTTLVTQLNHTNHEPFGGGLEFLDATPDLNHVVFTSETPLTTGGGEGGLYEWSANSPQHALALVSVLPKAAPSEPETPATSPSLGSYPNTDGNPTLSRNAISSDGSRIDFTSAFVRAEAGHEEANERAYLFMREPAKSESVQINKVEPGVSEPGEAERANEEIDQVRFQTASTDGSKVFFTDTEPLTHDSALHPTEETHPADLYEWNVETRKPTDMTVDQNVGERADVLGVIPGASEDGSYVYFVANGVLAPGASRGDCAESPQLAAQSGAACNLYVSTPSTSHPGTRETRLIARLSEQDAADWGLPRETRVVGDGGNTTYLTSRVSPGDGEWLAFMSDQRLTGYDNEDAVSKAPDEEVYLYNAKLGSLVCASCNPSGERPHGVFDTEKAGEGLGLLVDRPEVWRERWIAGSIPGWTSLAKWRATYQSRYLSSSGRLFFDSADTLVPQDQNHKEDVYEYEPGGVGNCASAGGCVSLISSGAKTDEHESAFLDASASGNDVFFLTSEKLVAGDTDTAFDVYDARICGTSESAPCLPVKPPPPPTCSGEQCRPPTSPQPSFAGSATATFSGPGNVPATGVLNDKTNVAPKPKVVTRAQKLSKALKSCRGRFKHGKKQRQACEKQARKKYGQAKKAGHRASSHAARSSTGGRR